jgi:hypothetical protein
MRKQEYIHLHALLAEVSTDVSENDCEVALDDYETLGIRPSSIHKSKNDHKEAVQALATCITESVDTTTEDVDDRVTLRAD